MEITNPLSIAAVNSRLDTVQSTLLRVEDTVDTLYKLITIVLTNQKTLLMQHSMIITDKSLFPEYTAPEYAASKYAAPEYTAPEYVAPEYTTPEYTTPKYLGPSTHNKESECI